MTTVLLVTRLNSFRSNYWRIRQPTPFVYHAYRWERGYPFLIADEKVLELPLRQMILKETVQSTKKFIDRLLFFRTILSFTFRGPAFSSRKLRFSLQIIRVYLIASFTFFPLKLIVTRSLDFSISPPFHYIGAWFLVHRHLRVRSTNRVNLLATQQPEILRQRTQSPLSTWCERRVRVRSLDRVETMTKREFRFYRLSSIFDRRRTIGLVSFPRRIRSRRKDASLDTDFLLTLSPAR